MSTTFRIAKLQLFNLWYSPISWVLLAIFALYAGVAFTDAMDTYERMPPTLSLSMTAELFVNDGWAAGVLDRIQQILFLFIPILSMGLISNEINSGTIKLLYSSPIKIGSIVLGKYLAILAFSLTLLVLVATTFIGASWFIPHLDWPPLLAALFAMLLLISTYCALGLLMSCFTRYQVISGIATLATLYLLDLIASWGAGWPIVGGVFSWLSISAHTGNALKGLFVSSDLLFFVLLSALFLYFAVIKLETDRSNSKDKPKLWLKSGLATLAVAVLGYFLSLPHITLYKDFTTAQINTLPPEGQAIIKQLDQGPLTIRRYQNIISGAPIGWPEDNSQYVRFLPDMQVVQQYFYQQLVPAPGRPYDPDPFHGELKTYSAEKKAETIAYYSGLDMDDILPVERLEADMLSRFDGQRKWTAYEYQGKKVYMPEGYDDFINYLHAYLDSFTPLKRLLQPEAQVVFVSGQGERRIDRHWDQDWGRMALGSRNRYGMINHGFQPISIDLTSQPIPENTDILVIADPAESYSEEASAQIKAYIDNGGDLLIAAEAENNQAVSPILALFGVELGQAAAVTQDNAGAGNRINRPVEEQPAATPAIAKEDSRIPPANAGNRRPFDAVVATPVTEDGRPTFAPAIPGRPAALVADAQIDPYFTELFTRLNHFEPKKVVMDGVSSLLLDEVQGFDVRPLLTVEGKLGGTEAEARHTVAAALTREVAGKQQKITLFADADFWSDKEMNKNIMEPRHDNSFFMLNLLAWYTDGVWPVMLYEPEHLDGEMLLSKSLVKTYKVIYIVVIPLLIAGFGVFIWLRRRAM